MCVRVYRRLHVALTRTRQDTASAADVTSAGVRRGREGRAGAGSGAGSAAAAAHGPPTSPAAATSVSQGPSTTTAAADKAQVLAPHLSAMTPGVSVGVRLFIALVSTFEQQVSSGGTSGHPMPPALLRLVQQLPALLAQLPPRALASETAYAAPLDDARGAAGIGGVSSSLFNALSAVHAGARQPDVTTQLAVAGMLGVGIKQASLERLAHVLRLLVAAPHASGTGAVPCDCRGLADHVRPFLAELHDVRPVARAGHNPSTDTRRTGRLHSLGGLVEGSGGFKVRPPCALASHCCVFDAHTLPLCPPVAHSGQLKL